MLKNISNYRNLLFGTLFIFTLTLIGWGASILIGSFIPLWLLFGFSTLYSIEKWFLYYARKYKIIGKIYRLILNLSVLSLFGLVIWSCISLFSQQFMDSPLIGSLVLLVELVIFIWLCRFVAKNSWRQPSMKLTVLSLICLFIIFAFAGVQPFAEVKDNIFTRITEHSKEAPVTPTEMPAPTPVYIPESEEDTLPTPYPTRPEEIEGSMPALCYITSDAVPFEMEMREVNRVEVIVGLDFSPDVKFGKYRINLVTSDETFGEKLFDWYGQDGGVIDFVWDVEVGTTGYFKLKKGFHAGEVFQTTRLYEPFIVQTTGSVIEMLGDTIFSSVNSMRDNKGLTLLQYNEDLHDIAKEQASVMAVMHSPEYVPLPYPFVQTTSAVKIRNGEGIEAIAKQVIDSWYLDQGNSNKLLDIFSELAISVATIDMKNYYVSAIYAPRMDSPEYAVHRLINHQREEAGIPWVRWSNDMYALAKSQSAKMADEGRIFHSSRYALDGGENCWMSDGHYSDSQLPAVIVESWMSSTTGHREWLLQHSVEEAGVGITSSTYGTFAAWAFSD